MDEGEELYSETLKKYKSTVSQISVDQITLAEQSTRVAELEQEKQVHPLYLNILSEFG